MNGRIPGDGAESPRHRGVANNPASSINTSSAAQSSQPQITLRDLAPAALDTAVYIRLFVLLLRFSLGEMELIKAFGSFVALVVARTIASYCQEILVVAPLEYLFERDKTTQHAPPDGSQAREPSGERTVPSFLSTEYKSDPPLSYFERHLLLPDIEDEDDGSMSWEDVSEGPLLVNDPPSPEIKHRRLRRRRESTDAGPGTQPRPRAQVRRPAHRLTTPTHQEGDLSKVRPTPRTILDRGPAKQRAQTRRLQPPRAREAPSRGPGAWHRTHEKAEQASAELESLLETTLAILILDEGRRTRQKDAAAMEDEFDRETRQRQERQGRYDAAMGWSSELLRELFDLAGGNQ
ncbi:hypothetical protein GE09DRAFT_300279 [Coniochaeta sp. 2T2.1]|nr:hypothetical protein GE09DRAFT_300279 [Coniochaeta sp. 2T2.1]